MRTPGVARASAIAVHWAVHEDRARAILAAQGVTPKSAGLHLYAWEDVWRIEGAGHVPPSLFEAYRAPMLDVAGIGRGDARDLARGLRRRCVVDLGPSALRERVAGIGAPVVRLGPRIRRIRPCDLPALVDLLAAPPGKVRRRPASGGRTTPQAGD